MLLTNCQSSRKIEVKRLVFTTEVTLLQDLESYKEEYLINKYGDSVTLTFHPNGSLRWDYYGGYGWGLEYSIFDQPSNLYYTKYKGIDTLYYYNFEENSLLLKSRVRISDTLIGNVPCRAVRYNCLASDNQEIPITHTLFYNLDTLQLNQELYTRWKDFFMADFFKENGVFYLERHLVQPESYMKQRIRRVYPEYFVSEKVFEIPKEMTLVKL
ncbi:MAG: hypothetical protein N4A41_10595 [Crocinitomicaceae bacterium]|nr:hypothetical protein [Crocinitomicaceae bacterium]